MLWFSRKNVPLNQDFLSLHAGRLADALQFQLKGSKCTEHNGHRNWLTGTECFLQGFTPPTAGPARHDIFEDTMGMLEFDEGISWAVRKSIGIMMFNMGDVFEFVKWHFFSRQAVLVNVSKFNSRQTNMPYFYHMF